MTANARNNLFYLILIFSSAVLLLIGWTLFRLIQSQEAASYVVVNSVALSVASFGLMIFIRRLFRKNTQSDIFLLQLFLSALISEGLRLAGYVFKSRGFLFSSLFSRIIVWAYLLSALCLMGYTLIYYRSGYQKLGTPILVGFFAVVIVAFSIPLNALQFTENYMYAVGFSQGLMLFVGLIHLIGLVNISSGFLNENAAVPLVSFILVAVGHELFHWFTNSIWGSIGIVCIVLGVSVLIQRSYKKYQWF